METKKVEIEGITVDDLSELLTSVEERVVNRLGTLLNERLKPQGVSYLNRKDVQRMFNVSLKTVDNWTNQHILKSYSIGGLVMFKKHEVEESLRSVTKPQNRC